VGVSTKAPEPYPLSVEFQRVVAAMLVCRPALYGVVGHAIEVARLSDPVAVLTVRAVQAYAKDLGRGPSSYIMVAQRLHRWMHEGTTTYEEIGQFADLIDDYADKVHVMPDDEVLVELVPLLQRIRHGETALAAIQAYQKNEGFEEIRERIQATEALGKVDKSLGSKFGLEALDEIMAHATSDRLSTGIHELDIGLNGGLARGKMGLFVAGKSTGKSMYLINQVRTGLELGLTVALATLELPEYEQNSRLIANFLGWPIDRVRDPSAQAELHIKLPEINKRIGSVSVRFFTPKVTNFGDVAAWVRDVEQKEGRKTDLLVVDYIDKLGSSNRKHDTEYLMQGQATEDMRIYVEGRGMWGWSASQPKRREAKARKTRIEAEDVADSMNKVRAIDLMVSAVRPSENEIELYVGANNHGPCGFGLTPLPHDFACGRIVARPDGELT